MYPVNIDDIELCDENGQAIDYIDNDDYCYCMKI